MGLKDHDLETHQGILIHLVEFDRFRDDHVKPSDITQKGIAERMRIPRGYISYVLTKMIQDGSVLSSLEHIRSKKRKVKAYFITEEGRSMADELISGMMSRKVRFSFRGEPFDLTMNEAVEMTGTPMLDIILRTGFEGYDDIEGETPIRLDPRFEAICGSLDSNLDNFVGRSDESMFATSWFERGKGALLINGIAGSGKTTFALSLLNRWTKDLPVTLVHRIKGWEPVKYLLSEVAIQMERTGRSKLSNLILEKGSIGLDEFMSILATEVEESKLMIVLDDLHEIEDPRLRKRILVPLLDLTKQGLRLILISRSVLGIEDPRSTVLNQNIVKMDMGPLDEGDIDEFFQKEGLNPSSDLYETTKGHPLYMRLISHYLCGKGMGDAKRDILEFIKTEVLSNLGSQQRNLLDILTMDRLGIHMSNILEIDSLELVFSMEDVCTLAGSGIVLIEEGVLRLHDLVRSLNSEFQSRDRRSIVHDILFHYYMEESEKLVCKDPDDRTEDHLVSMLYIKEAIHHGSRFMGPLELLSLLSDHSEELMAFSETELVKELTDDILDSIDGLDQECDLSMVSRVLLLNGWCHSTTGVWDKAMERYRKALDLSRKAENENMEGRCRNAIGSLHLQKGELYHAQKHISGSIVHLKSDIDRSKALSNLSLVNWKLDDLDLALEQIDGSLSISTRIGDIPGILRALNNKGIMLLERGELEESKEIFEMVLSKCRTHKFVQMESIVLDNLGELHVKNGHNEEAKECFVGSLSIARDLGFKWQIAEVKKNLALISDPGPERLSLLLESKRLFEELGAHEELRSVLDIMDE